MGALNSIIYIHFRCNFEIPIFTALNYLFVHATPLKASITPFAALSALVAAVLNSCTDSCHDHSCQPIEGLLCQNKFGFEKRSLFSFEQIFCCYCFINDTKIKTFKFISNK